jgi:hypothetical protein
LLDVATLDLTQGALLRTFDNSCELPNSVIVKSLFADLGLESQEVACVLFILA